MRAMMLGMMLVAGCGSAAPPPGSTSGGSTGSGPCDAGQTQACMCGSDDGTQGCVGGTWGACYCNEGTISTSGSSGSSSGASSSSSSSGGVSPCMQSCEGARIECWNTCCQEQCANMPAGQRSYCMTQCGGTPCYDTCDQDEADCEAGC